MGPPGVPGKDATVASLACDALASNAPDGSSTEDLVIEVDGISGESTLTFSKGAIDITSFCMGGVSAADNGVLAIEKRLDRSTPPLLQALQSARKITKATVKAYDPLSSDLVASYEFSGVFVTGYRFGGHDDFREDVVLRWSEVTVDAYGAPPQTIAAPADWTAQSMPVCDALTETRDVGNADYDGYLKTAAVAGDSRASLHKGEIDVMSVCFGATNVDLKSPQFTALVMSKRADVSTTGLYTSFAESTSLGKTDLVLERPGPLAPDALRVSLPASTVDGMRSGIRGTYHRDDVSLSWTGGTLAYVPEKSDGSEGTPIVIEISR